MHCTAINFSSHGVCCVHRRLTGTPCVKQRLLLGELISLIQGCLVDIPLQWQQNIRNEEVGLMNDCDYDYADEAESLRLYMQNA